MSCFFFTKLTLQEQKKGHTIAQLASFQPTGLNEPQSSIPFQLSGWLRRHLKKFVSSPSDHCQMFTPALVRFNPIQIFVRFNPASGSPRPNWWLPDPGFFPCSSSEQKSSSFFDSRRYILFSDPQPCRRAGETPPPGTTSSLLTDVPELCVDGDNSFKTHAKRGAFKHLQELLSPGIPSHTQF